MEPLARAARRVRARVESARDRRDRRGPLRGRDRAGRRSTDGATFAVDEAPRRDTSAEKLASLKPAFLEDGVVTAGNSSQIVDGAAAMLVASEAAAARLGLTPRARFVSFGIAGVDPFRMLHGNPQACAQALRRAGLGWDDIAVIEINEAFASVVLQTLADTGPARALGVGRRQPERRRHLARPPSRRHGCPDHRHAACRARAARCALRPRLHVHRPGPGDRRRRRTPLALARTSVPTTRPPRRAGAGTRGARAPPTRACAARARPACSPE